MAKESGLGMTVTVDDSGGTGRDISNDVTSLTFATPRALQDATGVDKSAGERVPLLSDFTAQPTGVFNDATNKSFDVYKNAHTGTAARTLAIAISGQTLSCETFASASYTRGAGGELTWQADHQLADGTVPTWA